MSLRIRLGCFAAVLVAVGLWEAALPRRARLLPRRARWPANLGLVALNTLAVWLAFLVPRRKVLPRNTGWRDHSRPVRSCGIARVAGECAPAVMVLDFVIWLQHVMVQPCRYCGGCTASIMPTPTCMT